MFRWHTRTSAGNHSFLTSRHAGLTWKPQFLRQLHHPEEVKVCVRRGGSVDFARGDLALNLLLPLEGFVPPVNVVQDHVDARQVEANADNGEGDLCRARGNPDEGLV